MKATLQFELQPFVVPNFVRRKASGIELGREEEMTFPLSDIDALTLDRLCEQFRNEIFRKAGKEQPPTTG